MLKPNSGQAVTIGEHHICVGFHEETGSDYRVWEWHGHILLFDEENGYTPEYIYGNYFERLTGKASQAEEEEEKVGNFGLRELIDGGDDSGPARIVHRNINAVTLCPNGHTLCSSCKTRVQNCCPTCRNALGNIRKLTWQGIPRSIRDSHRKVRDSQDGLIIQRNLALFFSGGNRQELKLKVAGRIWKEH